MQNWPMLLMENDEGTGGKRSGQPWVPSFHNTVGRGSAGGQHLWGLGISGSPHTVHQQLLPQSLPLNPQLLPCRVTFEGASAARSFQVSTQRSPAKAGGRLCDHPNPHKGWRGLRALPAARREWPEVRTAPFRARSENGEGMQSTKTRSQCCR